MMILTQAAKNLKEALRQPKNLALTLGLPVSFMVIFGFAFGGADTTTYDVIAINDDEGSLGETYLANLANLTYSNGDPMVRVSRGETPEASVEDLKSRRFDLFLRLPANFSADLTPGGGASPGDGQASLPIPGQTPQRPPPPKGTVVDIMGDPASVNFNGAKQVVDAYTQAFAAEASGQPPLVRVESEFITGGELTQFDFIAPGLMIYAILSIAPQAASALARETELRTIDRLRASPARAATLLGGVALAQIVLAAVSLAFMLFTAYLMGFHNQGSYLSAYLIALGAAVSVVGVGMIIAAFARTQQEAANLGVLFAVPTSFLSGAFFPVPGVKLFNLGSGVVGLYDVLPSTHAVEAMRDVMTFGRGLDAVAVALLAMTVLAAVYFVVGVALYRRNRLAPE